MSIKDICSLRDCKELKKLIVENPECPLLIFCSEDSWSGFYDYESQTDVGVSIQELTNYNGEFLDKDEFEEKISNDLCDDERYAKLSDEEFEAAVKELVSTAEFVKCIIVYCG